MKRLISGNARSMNKLFQQHNEQGLTLRGYVVHLPSMDSLERENGNLCIGKPTVGFKWSTKQCCGFGAKLLNWGGSLLKESPQGDDFQ
jgi:hypothetical protein